MQSSGHEKIDMQILMETAATVGLDVALNIQRGDRGADTSDDEIEERPGGTDFSKIEDSHLERFLAYHRWDQSDAVFAVRKHPVRAFRKAQIQLPKSSELAEESNFSGNRTCLICIEDIEDDSMWMTLQSCNHGFCSDCLKDYIVDCAKSMTPVSKIMCPMNGCKCSISGANLDTLLKDKPETLDRITEATVRHFVSTAYDHKYCNHPGCSGILRRVPQRFFTRNKYDPDLHDYFGAVCTAGCLNRCPPGSTPVLTYDGVEDSKYNNCKSREQPVRAHRFCFSCGDSVHWPVPCDKFKEWKEKMRDEINLVEDDDEEVDANEIAQKIWIKANTRACPQCDVLIEKNDGCNHMTCVNPNCRYEFCWICRKDWKLHGSATGGFFRCNILKEDESPGAEFPAPPAATSGEDGADEANNQGYGTAIHSSRDQYRKRQEMNRFIHHFTRYAAHGDSARLEGRMAENASIRLAPVVDAAIEFDGSPAFNFGGKGLSFIHSAFTELLECRSTLKYSYAFSFFRYPTFFHFRKMDELKRIRKEKHMFEKYQSELEMITEQMSDILARSHIRASQVQISFVTAGAAEKRIDFSSLMFSILHQERGKKIRPKADFGDEKQKHRRSGDRQNPWTSESDSSSDDDFDEFEDDSPGRCEICATPRAVPG